jgi:sRNA-binding carbon storage regulator CsrA
VVVGGTDGFHRLLRVKVLDIRGTNVKLGFEVDPDVPVHAENQLSFIKPVEGPCSPSDKYETAMCFAGMNGFVGIH